MKPNADASIPAFSDFLQQAQARRQTKTLGQRLVLQRGNKTQEEYAALLEIHVNTLARYERGERLPTVTVLLKLRQLGVNIDHLLAGLHDVG